MDRLEARNKAYLQPYDQEKAKERHETFAVELRKQRRVERYLQKRARHQLELLSPTTAGQSDPLTLSSPLLQSFKFSTSPDHSRQLLFQIRLLCAVPDHPPLHLITQANITAKLAGYLSSADPEEVFAATWIFTNLASLNDDAVMREIGAAGVVGKLVACLEHERVNIVENGIWALGNYAGGEEHCREEVLAAGILPKLDKIARELGSKSEEFCELFTWLFCILTKTHPKPQHLAGLSSLIVLCLHLPYDSSVLNALTSAYQLSVKDPDCISALLAVHIAPVLLSLLAHSSLDIQFQALKVAGNICAGTDQHTALLLHQGLLETVCPLVEAKERNMRKEAFWLLSNVLASDRALVEMTVRHRCFGGVIKGLNDADLKIRKEAIICLGNLVDSRAEVALEAWDDMEGLERVCESLAVPEPMLQKVAIDTIQEYVEMVKQLRTGQTTLDRVISRLEAAGAIHQLGCLLHHSTLHHTADFLLRSLHEDSSEALKSAATPLLFQFS